MERKWSSEKEVERERERNVREKKDVQTTSRQPENLSRFNDDKRKPDQETVATSGEDVESKKCQGPRLPRDHAVDGRASQAAIPIGSPFSLQKGTPWECTFLLIFKTATTLKFKLQIKLCSCPLESIYCLKKCPDTISAEYARWLQHNYNIPIPANKCSIQNKYILLNKSNLPLGQRSVFLQGQYPNKMKYSLKSCTMPFEGEQCAFPDV